MAGLQLKAKLEQYRLASPFRISGYVFEETDVLFVELRDGAHSGRGEAAGVYFLKDDADHMMVEVERHRELIESGVDRQELRRRMPAGGARNALDCALWELEASRQGTSVHKLAGIDTPKPLVTTFTLGADSPEEMARRARLYQGARAIKIKLTGELELDIERIRAVRGAQPDAWFGVDANQGYARETLPSLFEVLVVCKVSLLEQPLPRGREDDLEGLDCPVPIAADESILTLEDLEGLVGRVNVINIKLDKCGGLTEGLEIASAARRLGFGVMVGNMVGTSLAMAPAFVLGQLCDIVDLDGPIFLKEDRKPSIIYDDGYVWAGAEVWGSPRTVFA